jgi:hypothetical protein
MQYCARTGAQALERVDKFCSSRNKSWTRDTTFSAGIPPPSRKTYTCIQIHMTVVFHKLWNTDYCASEPFFTGFQSIRRNRALFSKYEGCSKSIRPLAGKNTFTRLEVSNPNPLPSSLLVTEHTSPSDSTIV